MSVISCIKARRALTTCTLTLHLKVYALQAFCGSFIKEPYTEKDLFSHVKKVIALLPNIMMQMNITQ